MKNTSGQRLWWCGGFFPSQTNSGPWAESILANLFRPATRDLIRSIAPFLLKGGKDQPSDKPWNWDILVVSMLLVPTWELNRCLQPSTMQGKANLPPWRATCFSTQPRELDGLPKTLQPSHKQEYVLDEDSNWPMTWTTWGGRGWKKVIESWFSLD